MSYMDDVLSFHLHNVVPVLELKITKLHSDYTLAYHCSVQVDEAITGSIWEMIYLQPD